MSEIGSPAVVDFHVHYVDPAHPPALWASARPEVAALRERTVRRIVDLDDVLASAEAGGVATRVLNAPPSLVAAAGTTLTARVIREINDHLARQVAVHPGRLVGLATIDAWQGEEAATELRRAVTELHLSGAVVDAAASGGDRLLDDPAAYPTLRTAAELGVPVFVHPINPRGFTDQLEGIGRAGTLLARGAIDAASLLALLNSRVVDDLPHLRIVIPLIGAPALLLGTFTGLTAKISRHAPEHLRRHVYVDTMGFDPASIRFLVDVVGADHVLVGSDSPIVAESIHRDEVLAALASAGLDEAEVAAVAGGNARRLLGIVEAADG
ncbi:amidohydrolase family protein [Verrucosispora sp. TAA-831]|uniref:amidohydrolase family protein n=1 Tax=Verrucosispora sp. TAA-831 TaxID=3422227 RepID=UPI003D6DBDD5